MTRTSPRRIQRSVNVCPFQVKKAIGRTVVNSNRLPSTRQYTRGAALPSPEL